MNGILLDESSEIGQHLAQQSLSTLRTVMMLVQE